MEKIETVNQSEDKLTLDNETKVNSANQYNEQKTEIINKTIEPIKEIVELDFKHKKGFNQFKNETDLRREFLRELIEKLSLSNVKKMRMDLAKQFQVSDRMIYKDLDWLKGHYKPKNLDEAKIDLEVARNEALRNSLKLLATAERPDDKVKAIATVIAASKHYREELEAWGLKDKTAIAIETTPIFDRKKMEKLTHEEKIKFLEIMGYGEPQFKK